MQLDLTGKVALVTGGGRGIGRAIAQALATAGATVVVNYRGNAATADETVATISAAGGTATMVQADVADGTAVEGLVKWLLRQWDCEGGLQEEWQA